MAAQEAQIRAFSEIATAFAVGIALSLPGPACRRCAACAAMRRSESPVHS